MNEVEVFIRRKMKEDSISSVAIAYMIPDLSRNDPQMIKGFATIRYTADGATERSEAKDPAQAIPPPGLNGKPIQ